MLILLKFRRFFVDHLLALSWQGIFLSLASFVLISWLGLWLCQETALTSDSRFIYWLIITSSTVGYGDLAPQTLAGQYFVSLFIVPFGISIFALVIGRIAAFATQQWKRGITGMKTLEVANHTLIIGWNEHRTLHLIQLLQDENTATKQTIVLCVNEEQLSHNPLPDQIGFIRVNSYNNLEEMQRARVKDASCIIIDTPLDDVTMTAALFSNQRNPKAHILAYFKDESLAELLKMHCPNVECMPSVSVEMLAKSAVDPGSSALHHELLSANKGMTQYSAIYPDAGRQTTVSMLFNGFKTHYDATLIAVRQAQTMQINPQLNSAIQAGDSIYYIANNRINNIDWEQFNV